MPRAIVWASHEALGQLEAEESLLAAQRVGVGSGTIERDQRRSIVREWQRLARGTDPPARLAGAAGVEAARQIGIGVRRVPTTTP